VAQIEGSIAEFDFSLWLAKALKCEQLAAALKQGAPADRLRRSASNLLRVNGKHYIIDAGDGIARRIAKAGINVRDIGTIFITHHHDDHTAGLGTLMSVAWDNQRTSPINVYGPPPTEALVKAAVQYYGISAEIRITAGGRSIPIAQVFNGHDVGPA